VASGGGGGSKEGTVEIRWGRGGYNRAFGGAWIPGTKRTVRVESDIGYGWGGRIDVPCSHGRLERGFSQET